MTTPTIYTAYQDIQDAWDNDQSASDIYHMILDWIEVWKPEIHTPEIARLIKEYLQRCYDDEETYNLVEDFIYGDRYAHIRYVYSIVDD